MINCLFCSLVSGNDQPVSIVYQDELVLAMMSPTQANPGHALITPKQWDQYYIKAVIDRPYDDPDALLRWLVEERIRRWPGERPRALGDECSPEVLDDLALRIRASFAEIWD